MYIFTINKIKLCFFAVFFVLFFLFAFQSPIKAQQCFDPGPGCNCSQCGPRAYSDPNCQVGGCPQYCPCGGGDWSCCSADFTPPAPKKYFCSQNKCLGGGSEGNYSGDANCGGNCGIECTITRLDNTKEYSGSSNVYNSDGTLKTALQKSNTGKCDGSSGTVNMVRSSNNPSSNPARFRVECNTEEFKESTVLRDWKINQIKFDNTEVYTKLNGIMDTSKAKITELNIPANKIRGKTYIQDFEIMFKDGIAYKHDASGNPIGFEISVKITDGLTTPNPPNPSVIESTISQFIDTSLPTNTRSVEVQTIDKFNVTTTATDDFLLRNYAYYVAPTAFIDPKVDVYPFISQKRGSNYLGVNQLETVSPVGNADFAPNTPVSGAGVFLSKAVSTKTVSRVAQYKLNLSQLVNQVEPYDISFGDGDDDISNGTFGRWYSEDHYCNAESGTPNRISVGSPWLQTKKGNVFIKGPSEINAKSANMSIYNFGTDCKLTAGNTNLPQSALTNCPEGGKANVSSYLFQTTQSKSNAGTAGTSIDDNSRLSRANIISSEYPHGMTYLSDYFKDSDSSAYNYYLSLINGIVSGSELNQTNPINTPCGEAGKSRVTGSDGDIEVIGANGGPSYNLLQNMAVVSDLGYSPCTDSNGINVVKINGNLTIDSLGNPPAGTLPGSGALNENTIAGNNPSWPHWYLSTDTVILVSGNVVINPDIRKDLDANAKSLIIIAAGKIEIGVGLYKSASKVNKTDYPFYDRIDAFLISDKQIITKSDPQASGKILDGLKVFGGLVQLGSSKYSTLDKCVKPNNPGIEDTSTDSNICFGRDLILMQNFLAPAETVEYDASVEDTFALAIGGTNFIYSLREVKTSTGVSSGN